MVTNAQRQDRARGLIVGQAVGDALGAPVEFDSPHQIAGRRDELFAMPGGGPFQWAPGEFTDDTQMALVLARHLIAQRGDIEPQSLVAAFTDWSSDAADVGNQTGTVLRQVAAGRDWQDAVAVLEPSAAGNGSLMRTSPVALVAPSRERAAELARRQSRLTHPNEACQEACALFVSLLWDALEGVPLDLDEAAARAALPEVRHAIAVAQRDEPPAMSGWVLHTLSCALWAVCGAPSYEDAVWRAVSLGRDADTVGAITGALAGAMRGYAAIPPSLSGTVQSQHRLFRGRYPDLLLGITDDLLALREPA